jgi:hypothetical protein
MWIYIPYHFEQAISQRLVFIILMLFMGLSQTGCINTLVRAVVDPQALATDVGNSVARNSARSLFSEEDLGSLSDVEQSVTRLDNMISKSDNPATKQELQALRDHVSKGLDNQVNRQITDSRDGIGSVSQTFTSSLKKRIGSVRRMGDLYADSAWVDYQPYKQRLDPIFDGVRQNNFERWVPQFDQLDDREHEWISERRYWSQSLLPLPNYGYGIDPKTGFIKLWKLQTQDKVFLQ